MTLEVHTFSSRSAGAGPRVVVGRVRRIRMAPNTTTTTKMTNAKKYPNILTIFACSMTLLAWAREAC